MTAHVRRRRVASAVSAVVLVALLAAACGSDDDSATSSATTTATVAERELTRPGAAPEGELPEATRAGLIAAVEETMTEFDVPGAVVGVFVPGEGSWIEAFGVADRASGAEVTTEMAWPLRSITKSFTVSLILQLVDEGRLSLDHTVDRYVDGVPNGDRVTIRQLADMTSGLPEYTTERFLDDFSADPTRAFTLDELNGYAFSEEPQFEPGAEHVYTNTNTNVLGAVIEQVTGTSYDEVVVERIIEPLGLDSTVYLGSDDGSGWVEPHALGYQPEEGGLVDQPPVFTIFGPAGAMVSTVEDQRVWAEVLATGALLDPATQATRLEGAPLDRGPEYDQYALGIGEVAGWWGHTGEGIGITALTMHDPDTGSTVVVFMNLSNTDGHPPTILFRRIAAVLDASGS